MCANSPSDVRVISRQTVTATDTCPAALTYPAVQRDFDARAVSTFTMLRSTYTETQPAYPSAIGEFTSDDWLHGPGGGFLQYEVMVWMDNQGQAPAGTLRATVKLGKAGTFDFYATNSGYMAFVRHGNLASGYIPHLTVYRWLINHGWLPSTVMLGQEEIGWEICTDPPGGGTYTITRNRLVIK